MQIRFSGPAGGGVNTAGEILCNILAKLGYEVFTNVEYESRIKGGVNNFDINISKNIKQINDKNDVLVGFNKESVERNLSSLKNTGIIFLSEKTIQQLDLQDIKNYSFLIEKKYENIELLSYFCFYFGIEKDLLSQELQKKLKIDISGINDFLNIIYSSKKQEVFTQIEKNGEEKQIFNGNELVAKGLLAGGLEFYSAYPMTPASSIFDYVLKHNNTDAKIYQAEDEIAVVNSALGASFTGARSAYGTSGGGFALTSEALSFAVQAEFPITAIFSQRAGPSTGTPTYFEQGDINYALNPTFGDFEHIVLYPSSMEEVYYFSGLALNLADIYQQIVILLIDKQISDMIATVDILEVPEINRGAFVKDSTGYKRYEINDSGISPRVEFGSEGGEFIATSYEHDEYGATSENVENKILMTEKRFKKLENFFKEQNFSSFELINEKAKKIIITYGFTSYNAKLFVENNPEFGLLIIKAFKPLNTDIFEILKDREEIIFVESNYSGQLQNYVTKEFGLNHLPNLKIKNLRKYNLHPFYIDDFLSLK